MSLNEGLLKVNGILRTRQPYNHGKPFIVINAHYVSVTNYNLNVLEVFVEK